MHEELMSEVEETVPTAVQKVRIVRTTEDEADVLFRALGRLADSVEHGDIQEVLEAVHMLVPEAVDPLRSRAARQNVQGPPQEYAHVIQS